MRILFASSEVPPTPSGMARVAERLTAGFRERGHDVDIVASEHLPRITYADVRIAPLLPHWRSVQRRAARADVVSLHGPIPTFSDFFLLMKKVRASALPPVAYMHHMDIRFRHSGWITSAYSNIYRRLAKSADVTIVSTEATAASFTGGDWARKVHVVPFGVDHGRVERCVAKARDFTVLFVGQLRPYKGVDVLLEAMCDLPGVKLKIAGRGYAADEYRATAARLGLRDVEFLGAVSDDELWRLYASSHVFVLPSTEMEYFGLAILEAMASGCVPVISDLPGPAEVTGDAGLIVGRRDARALADAIASLRDDAAKLTELSERARRRSLAFSWDRCVERHLELYEGIL